MKVIWNCLSISQGMTEKISFLQSVIRVISNIYFNGSFVTLTADAGAVGVCEPNALLA